MPITSYLLSKDDVSVLGYCARVLYRTLETILASTADPSRTAVLNAHWSTGPLKPMKHPHLFSLETDLPYVAQDSLIMPPALRHYGYKWEHMDNVCLLGLPPF